MLSFDNVLSIIWAKMFTGTVNSGRVYGNNANRSLIDRKSLKDAVSGRIFIYLMYDYCDKRKHPLVFSTTIPLYVNGVVEGCLILDRTVVMGRWK